jgi:single-stranded-DNA-specific exonuclease
MAKIEIKNLEKAAKRIAHAVKNKEKIIAYADADLDGVCSAIIFEETVKNLGGEVSEIYFPDREIEGYGINKSGLNCLKKFAPALFVSLDCGIGNFKEVEMANKMGFEVIIVDHHIILDKLPNASIIVDPKQKGDKYPFKGFANVGITFKLAQACLGKKMTDILKRNFLELTAIATIADMMPREDENEIMITEGLNYLESSWRPGLQALLESPDLDNLKLIEKVYKINSFLNIRDIGSRMPGAFRLLTALSKEEAKEMLQNVYSKALEKKERIAQIKEEIKIRLKNNQPSPIIFEGDSKWELVLLGVIASYLSSEFQKPVFLYKKLDKESHGSVRSPNSFNVVEAMTTYSKGLVTYGGHPQAAGFRIKNEKLEEFKETLIDYFSK